MIAYTGLCLFLMATAIPLIQRRIKPNRWYGVRLPRTIKNPPLWYEINAYGGKVLFICGLIGLVVSLMIGLIPNMPAEYYVALAGSAVGLSVLIGALIILWRLVHLDDNGLPRQ